MVRKLFVTLVAFLCLAGMPAVVPAQQPAPQKATDTKAVTVYITRTGKKYHRDGCRYLKNGRIPVSLKDADARLYAVQHLQTAAVNRPRKSGLRRCRKFTNGGRAVQNRNFGWR
jgi:hypothetical protein